MEEVERAARVLDKYVVLERRLRRYLRTIERLSEEIPHRETQQ